MVRPSQRESRRIAWLVAVVCGGVPCLARAAASQDASAVQERLSETTESGEAELEPGLQVYFELFGSPNLPVLFLVGISASADHSKADRNGYVAHLGERYRLLFADYPLGLGQSDPPSDPERMTAAQMCEDLLIIADAAGVEEFGVIGYSWGGNACLQLACASERVKVLVVGGWPALQGPYEESGKTTKAIAANQPESVPGIAGSPTAYWQQFVTYYDSLADFEERERVAALTCPRLNFVDEEDQFEFLGVTVDMVGRARDEEENLKAMGWEVVYVNSGAGHMGGSAPAVAAPVIAEFLERRWPPKNPRSDG